MTSSTPTVYGGFFPEFFPSTVDQPSQILPSELQQTANTCTFNHLPAAPNIKAKEMAFSLKEQKTQQGPELKTSIIIIEDNDGGCVYEKQWKNGLTKQDWDILAKSGWLTDNIINETQSLLKETVSSPEWTAECSAGSTIGCREAEINIYDSLPPATTPHLRNQIAALLATPKTAIKMSYMDTQMQSGTQDCGIFAIAFAVSLANGEQPGAQNITQPQTRKHLMQCLETGNIHTFPVTRKRRRGNKVKGSSSFSCRMPEQPGGTIIQCCSCKEWYHLTCVIVSQQAIGLHTKWFCNKCN